MFFRPSVHHSSPPQLPLDVLFMRMDDDDPSPKRKRMSVVCEGRFSLSSGSSFSLLWIRYFIAITGIKASRISQITTIFKIGHTGEIVTTIDPRLPAVHGSAFHFHPQLFRKENNWDDTHQKTPRNRALPNKKAFQQNRELRLFNTMFSKFLRARFNPSVAEVKKMTDELVHLASPSFMRRFRR